MYIILVFFIFTENTDVLIVSGAIFKGRSCHNVGISQAAIDTTISGGSGWLRLGAGKGLDITMWVIEAGGVGYGKGIQGIWQLC